MTSAHAPIVAAATALLGWSHRRGGQARTLVRLRTIRTDTGLATAVVASELRDNPRGYEIGSDFAALANTALRQLIPAAVPHRRSSGTPTTASSPATTLPARRP